MSYDATHSTESDRCDLISMGGIIDGDGKIVFADDMISLNGHDGGYLFIDLYIDGKGYTSIPIDIKAVQDGITIDELLDDPCKYGHMLSAHQAAAATSDADGNIAYYTCNTCDKAFVFNDWRKETEISLEDTVIKRIKTLSLNKKSFTYNGSVQKPALIIKDSDGKKIDSKYYTAAFSNKKSKDAGSYSVKVKFKGNYAGTKKLTYKIKKAANPMTVKTGTPSAKASKDTTISKAGAFKISRQKGKLKFTKISGNSRITVASNGRVTVKKGLKKGRTYSVKVKVTAKGNTNYKAKAKKVTLKIRVK